MIIGLLRSRAQSENRTTKGKDHTRRGLKIDNELCKDGAVIYVHSLGRGSRYFPKRTALAANGTRSTFRELHARVGRIAAALTKHGFKAGDRLAILLPNEPDYIQLVYACAWLGVTAVPLNTRLSVKELMASSATPNRVD